MTNFLSVLDLSLFFAQAGGKGPAKPESCMAMGMSQLVMIGALVAIFYFLLIRPQQKKAKEHQEMLKAIKKGDVVATTGGIIGTVCGVADRFITVEIAEKVRVRVLRSAVAGKESGGDGNGQKSEGKK